MKKAIVFIAFAMTCAVLPAQNIGINTDGTAAETGLMLDVKGTSPIATTAALQNIFQVKSYDADATALKLRLGLKTDANTALRYGLIDVYDAGAAAYRHLALQPLGGNVGVGTTAPGWQFTSTGSGAAASTEYLMGAFNQVTSLGGMYLGYYTDGAGTALEGRIRAGASKELAIGTTSFPRAMYILNASGFVSVGSTAPVSRLEVFNGDFTVRAGATFPDDPGDIVFKNNGGTQKARIWSSSSATTALNMNGDGTGVAAMTIDANANVGVATTTPYSKFDVNGSVAYREGGALTLANGTNSNISLGTSPYFSYYRISGPTAAFTITGIVPPTSSDGMLLTLYVTVAQQITIVNNLTSTAANQITTLTGANIVATGPCSIQLQYNANISKWLVLNIHNSNNGMYWSLLGNAGTSATTNFLGTTDNVALNFRVNNVKSGVIPSNWLASTFFGYEAGLTAGANLRCTGMGYGALKNVVGQYNTGFGWEAYKNSSAGERNTAFGFQAIGDQSGGAIATGSDNVGVGYTTLGYLTSGAQNVAIGTNALGGGTFGGPYFTGSDNVAVGYQSLVRTTSGSKNVAIGSGNLGGFYGAGYTNTTGSSNVFIGYNSNTNAAVSTNRTAIGALSYVAADNCMVLGSINGINGATASTNVGIGTTTPGAPLHVAGGTIVNTVVDQKVITATGNFTGASDFPGGIGSFCTFTPSGSITLAYGLAVVANANPAATRTITDINVGHFRFDSQAASAGAVTNVSVLNAASPSLPGLKPTTIAGLRVKNQGVAGVGTAYGLYVEAQSGATTANYAGVFQGGNVGIGTVAPTEILHVEKNQDAKTRLSIKNTTAGTSAACEFITTRADGKLASFGVGDPAYAVSAYPADFRGAYIYANTQAGIALRSDDVAGPIRFVANGTGIPTEYMRIAPTGAIRFNGYGAGTLVTDASGNISASSDSRLKIIQGNFTKGISAVMGLTPALYKWNSLSGMETEGVYAGFIAQNVQQFIPEAVANDPRGFLTLSDRPVLAVLVNAIKEQQSMIEKLNAENAALKASSEKRVAKLEEDVQLLLQLSKMNSNK